MYKYWDLKYKEIVEESKRLQLSNFNKGLHQIENGETKIPLLMCAHWSYTSGQSGSFKISFDKDRQKCNLEYKLGRRLIYYAIDVIKKPTHNRGFRYFWLCPHCNRPIRTLYKAINNDLFLCRKCSNLIYWEQKTHSKAMDKLIKIYGKDFC